MIKKGSQFLAFTIILVIAIFSIQFTAAADQDNSAEIQQPADGSQLDEETQLTEEAPPTVDTPKPSAQITTKSSIVCEVRSEVVTKSGIVYETGSLEGINNVQLSFENEDTGIEYVAWTNSDGYYSISFPEGIYNVTLTREGFNPVFSQIKVTKSDPADEQIRETQQPGRR